MGKDVETEKALARIQQAEQDDLARLSGNSRHIIVGNSGHFIMQDQADEFVGAVSEFAKQSFGIRWRLPNTWLSEPRQFGRPMPRRETGHVAP